MCHLFEDSLQNKINLSENARVQKYAQILEGESKSERCVQTLGLKDK